MEYPFLMKRKTENGLAELDERRRIKVKSEDVEMKSVEGCQSFCDANSANDIFGNRLALTLQWKNGTGAKEITV